MLKQLGIITKVRGKPSDRCHRALCGNLAKAARRGVVLGLPDMLAAAAAVGTNPGFSPTRGSRDF